jgi:DNA adenine methylase
MTAPFLKWVGSKRKLVPQLLERLPSDVGSMRYVEPFVGGGSLFFELAPKNALLADVNADLITTYEVVRDNVDELIDRLSSLCEKRAGRAHSHYYEVRDKFNCGGFKDAAMAAFFIYLNKTCFNGVFRVNRLGEFNVPIGDYTNPVILDEAALRACSEILQGVELRCSSFEELLPSLGAGDFVYVDPPYIDAFASYAAGNFDDDKHQLLAHRLAEATDRGVRVLVSNSNVPRAHHLYGWCKNAGGNVELVSSSRSVNSDTTKRGAVLEMVARNY